MLSRRSSHSSVSPTIVQTPATFDSQISSFPKTPVLRVEMDCAPFSKSFPNLLVPQSDAIPLSESTCTGIACVTRNSGLRHRASFQIRSITNIKDLDPEWEHDEIEEIMIISPKAKARASFLDLGVNEALDISEFEVLKVIGKEPKVRTVLARGCSDLGVYAIKTLSKNHAPSRLVSRVKNEQACLKMVTGGSPFLPNLHRSFHDEARLYMILDTYPGGNLALLVERDGHLPPDKARFYASEIIEALAFLHELKIVHRDVSPQNVMIASDGHVVVTNFSYAKLLDDCEGTFSSCGDKRFESPERILGWMYDFAVDIWSFGVLLCIMHFGQHPFLEGHELDPLLIMQKRILRGQGPNHPSEITPLSEWNLIKKCLEKNPHLRPQVAQIKTHEYFDGLDWTKVTAKGYPAPYIPYGDEVDLLGQETGIDESSTEPCIESDKNCEDELDLQPAAFNSFSFTWDRFASPETPLLDAFPATPFSEDFFQEPESKEECKKRSIFRKPSVYFARDSRNTTMTKAPDFLDLCYSTSQLSLHESTRPRKLRKRPSGRSYLNSSALASRKSVVSKLSELSMRKTKKKRSTIFSKRKSGYDVGVSCGTVNLPPGITQTGKGIGFTPSQLTSRSRMSVVSVAPNSCMRGLAAMLGFGKKPPPVPRTRDEVMQQIYGSTWSVHEAQNSTVTFGIPDGLGPRRDSVDEMGVKQPTSPKKT